MAGDPNLEGIVNRMIKAGVDKDTIGKFIQEHQRQNATPYHGPESFGEGFMDSLTNGEALGAGMKGLWGYGKGALLDLVPNAVKGVIGAGSMLKDYATMDPTSFAVKQGGGMYDTVKDIADKTKMAGSQPEEFGRMMGQITGQPALTELSPSIMRATSTAVPKAASAVKSGAGKVLETGGGVMRKYQPVSGTLPRIAEPRIMRTVERATGGAIEDLGKRMQVKKAEVAPTIYSGKIPPKGLKPGGPIQQGPTVTPPERRLTFGTEMEPQAPAPHPLSLYPRENVPPATQLGPMDPTELRGTGTSPVRQSPRIEAGPSNDIMERLKRFEPGPEEAPIPSTDPIFGKMKSFEQMIDELPTKEAEFAAEARAKSAADLREPIDWSDIPDTPALAWHPDRGPKPNVLKKMYKSPFAKKKAS